MSSLHNTAAPLPPNAVFWFGTDLLGRDLFSRVLYGAQTSLVIGLVANGAALLIGTLVGVTAGYFRGETFLTQSYVITFIVVEVSLVAVALALVINAYRSTGSLDIQKLARWKG